MRTWGNGTHRALLLHGLSSNAESWWRVGPDLAALGWHVTAPDLRGHGKSAAGADYTLDGYRDDILELGGGWDLVVGHSLGGLVALACQLADRGFGHALVLEDPALLLEPTEETVDWLVAEYGEAITEESLAASRPRWAPGDVAGKVRALRQCGEEVVRRTLFDIGAIDMWSSLGEIAVPTLVMGADPAEDALVSEARGKTADTLPHVRYLMVPGASHSIHRDSYEPFMDELFRFAGESAD